MRVITALLVCFAASVVSYKMISPSNTTGWTNTGPQTMTWQGVKTDPPKFTVVLIKENTDSMAKPIVIAEDVDGTLGEISLPPPKNGWPKAGESYRLNMVKDRENIDNILAQSSPFTIKQGTGSATSSTTAATTSSKQADNAAMSSYSTAQSTDETDQAVPTTQSNDVPATSVHVGALTVALLAILLLE